MSDKNTEGSGVKVEDRRHWKLSEEEQVAEDAARAAAAEAEEQVMPFKAETTQLLDLFIRSIYSNKEIFLRELISNASDALDRLRFEALTRPELQGDDELEIRLETDAEARTLTLHDNGVGMSRDELVENIGTIARSGTREMLAKLAEGSTSDDTLRLIGQFGIGFYSAFMVADRVELVTRRVGELAATRWASKGDGTYTVSGAAREGRGTSVTLHLKEADAEDGLEDFTSEWVLDRVVKRYSDFVRYPVRLKVEREQLEQDEEGKPKADGKKTTIVEDRTLNSMKAIWLRGAGEVEQEEYDRFYKQISHDWEAPLKVVPLSAEGRLEYRALLFIPSKAPHDLQYASFEGGLQLYAQSVKIIDRCKDLLPTYLRFVKGVVDSPDVSLNVSRELLQQDRQITQIRAGITKKVLDTLTGLHEDEQETYDKVWAQFGRPLKEGVATDAKHKDRLVPLLRFASSEDAETLTTLEAYVGRMKPDQEAIYYLTGESREILEASPHLEAFKGRGYEMLYLTDPIDEFMLQALTEFDGHKLASASKGAAELGSEQEREQAEKERKEREEEVKGLLELLQSKLDAHVKEVRLSSRLTSSPACLVGGLDDLSPHLERLLRTQEGGGGPGQRRIMELNPDHPIVQSMKALHEKDAGDPALGDYAELLFGQALLAEGAEVPDPVRLSRLVAEVMVRAMGAGDSAGDGA
jgi:molecular chaperone HtpG